MPQPTIVMASIAAIAALMRFQAVFCVCNCSTPVIMCAVSLFWLLGPVEGVRVKGYRRKNSPHPDLFDGPVVDGMNDIPPLICLFIGGGCLGCPVALLLGGYVSYPQCL